MADPRNARKHPPRNIDEIATSLLTYGQQKNIVALENGRVVAGSGTILAAAQAGLEYLDVKIWTGSVQEAIAYGITDNRTGELAEWDEDVLAELLDELPPDLRLKAGFTEDEIMSLLDVDRDDDEPDDLDDLGPLLDVPTRYSDEQIIDHATAHYRERGFPYPTLARHEAMQRINALCRLPDSSLRNTHVGYHIADTYHPSRYAVRCGGRPSPVVTFARDDRLAQTVALVLAAEAVISDTSVLSALCRVRGTQAAAQFRPGFALWYMRRHCPAGGRILDTSAGWGGRLIGFAASSAAEYVGIDPSTEAVDGNRRMIDDLAIGGATLVQKPAEDVTVADVGGAASFDFALTSPPYFAKEHYADESSQSFKRYKTGNAWRVGFLAPMLTLQFAALKPGAVSVVNIADVSIGGKDYPLVRWAIESATSVGFDHVDTEDCPMPRTPGGGERPERSEPCLIFRKPE